MKSVQFSHDARGFSLIELMVVVAIIGIIAAIAYPSYQGYQEDTYRSQATADMRVCSLALERYFSDGFTYVGATIGTATTDECNSQSPINGAAQYVLSFPSAPTASDFIIEAKPVGGGACSGKCMRLIANGTFTEF